MYMYITVLLLNVQYNIIIEGDVQQYSIIIEDVHLLL